MLILLSLASGCGSPALATLKGTARWEGQPIRFGLVKFAPQGGPGLVVTATIEDGAYRAEGLAPGSYQATVLAFKEKTASTGVQLIPDDAEGNHLTIEVHAGQQSHDFAVVPKAP